MTFLGEIIRRNKYLTYFGLLNLFALVLIVLVSLFDHRTLLGINIWIKPMKFCISIALFSFTMAWLLHYLPQRKKVKIISATIIMMLLLEQILIISQAAMGEASHFNTTTIYNGAVFQIMGIAITINTIMVIWAFFLFGKAHSLPKGYLRGIRLGMLIFIIASLEGYLMVSNLGHTVNAPDGQQGYFFLNWAKEYGDLRIFHFLGLHALQALPIFAWYFAKEKMGLVNGFAIFYFLLSAGTLWNALMGRGLLNFGI
jgi:hypothetical protein